ncbi:MAG TPA: ATP-binding protein [Chlamydiales bacterium]
MDIHSLLAQPESKTLEFKRDLSSLGPVLKTIVAFANTAGGTLIIGRSSEGDILGVADIFKAEEQLAGAIAENIRPSMFPEIEIATEGNKNLLVVRVAHWRAPFYIKQQGIPRGVYIRLGSTSRPISEELLNELQRSVISHSYDEQSLSDVLKNSLDLDYAVQKFRHVEKEVSEEKLRALNVLIAAGNRLVPSVGGLILFGKNTARQSHLPDARVRCARFLGKDKVLILDQYEPEGTILDAVEPVLAFIQRNTRLAAEILSVRRKDIPEYPIVAVREALINALVHTDYSCTGAQIQVAIFDGRLEIQNPGMLPFGFTLEDLKTGVSRIRNRVIARVFHELKLMEHWGSGYKRIIEACKAGGYPEPKWEEFGTFIRVTFYSHPKTVIPTPERQPWIAEDGDHPEQDREQAILRLFENGERLPFRVIIKRIALPMSDRTLRYALKALKNQGLLESRGQGRALVWLRVRKSL